MEHRQQHLLSCYLARGTSDIQWTWLVAVTILATMILATVLTFNEVLRRHGGATGCL